MSQNPRQSKSIRAQLLTAMQVGEYAHCDRLPRESVLSEMLGISRTQLRDILASLEREGFIRCGTIYVEDGTPRVAFERITQRRNDMDPIFEIELGECPICRGAGVMQDEQGWSVSVSCMDCGAETADAEYRTPEERLESARRVALLWNMGKVIHNGMSD